MTKSEHRVRVDNGKYEFVMRDGNDFDIIAYDPSAPARDAVHAMMCDLDAARVVVQAARKCVEADFPPSLPAGLAAALALHDRLTDDREPPSAWCGAEPPPALATDGPPISLDDLERRATIDAQRLDGLHGDPSKLGGWIGHRDYARALTLLIPRLREAEAKVKEIDEKLAQARDRIREMED